MKYEIIACSASLEEMTPMCKERATGKSNPLWSEAGLEIKIIIMLRTSEA